MNKSSVHNAIGDNAKVKDMSLVQRPEFDHEFTKPILVTLMVFACLVSLFSNSLIIHVVRVNKNKRMRTTRMFFIVNMAFANVFVSICVTFYTTKYIFSGLEWSSGVFELFISKLFYYIELVSILCSVYSLVAITFDLFMAVVYPFKYKCSSSWTKYIVPLVWIASLTLPSHLIFTNIKIAEIKSLNDNKTYTVALDATLEAAIVASLGYIIPHVAMVMMCVMIAYKLCTRRLPGARVQNADHRHSAEHVKTAKKFIQMIVCILFVFNVCWFPSFFLVCFVYFMRLNSGYHSVGGVVACSIIAVSNGTFNSLIYAIFCLDFRAAFKSALGCG